MEPNHTTSPHAALTEAMISSIADAPAAKRRSLQRILELRLQGLGALKIANLLNEEGIRGRGNGAWYACSVRRQLRTLGCSTSAADLVWVPLPPGQEPPPVGRPWKGLLVGHRIAGMVEATERTRVLLRVELRASSTPPQRNSR